MQDAYSFKKQNQMLKNYPAKAENGTKLEKISLKEKLHSKMPTNILMIKTLKFNAEGNSSKTVQTDKKLIFQQLLLIKLWG